VLAGVNFVYSWTEPPTNPPDGNVAAPINTGSNTQLKEGALGVNGVLSALGSLFVINNSPQLYLRDEDSSVNPDNALRLDFNDDNFRIKHYNAADDKWNTLLNIQEGGVNVLTQGGLLVKGDTPSLVFINSDNDNRFTMNYNREGDNSFRISYYDAGQDSWANAIRFVPEGIGLPPKTVLPPSGKLCFNDDCRSGWLTVTDEYELYVSSGTDNVDMGSHLACFLTKVGNQNSDTNTCHVEKQGSSWILEGSAGDRNTYCGARCLD
jgi:hypothetical protein